MSLAVRLTLAWNLLLLAVAATPGQSVPGEERSKIHVPLKPRTKKDLDRAEALKLFGLGVIHERENRLVEALHTFEEAQRLDPDAEAPLRALIPLYLALDRMDDALATCRRVLERAPDDFETGYLYARQLRAQEKASEALEVLKKLAAQAALKEFPELQARIEYDLGLLYENAGSWPEAQSAYQKAAAVLDHPTALLEQGNYTKEEIANQAAETYERMGRTCLKQNKTKEAVAAFEQAQKRDPLRGPRLSFNLAEMHISRGETREALARLEEYLRSQPQGTEGYELKIKLLRKVGRSSDILPALEAASGRDPFNASLKLLLAQEYRREHRPAAAEDIYNQLLRSRPTPEVYKELFSLLKEEGRAGVGRALDLLNTAIEKATEKPGEMGHPSDAGEAARARAMLAVLREDAEMVKRLLPVVQQRQQAGPPLEKETRRLFATLAARARELPLAEELYRSCLVHGGGPGRPGESDIYSGLLQVLSLARKNKDIVELCDEGLKQAQTTNRVLFHLYRSEALMALNRTEDALAAADDAVKDSGEDEMLMSRRNRATLLSHAGKHAQAIAECLDLLKQYNNEPGKVREIRSFLSSIYSAAKDQAQAEEQLHLILAADPNDAGANNDLGYLWAEQNKNLPEAEKMIRKALELDRKQRRSGTSVSADADLDNAAYVDSLGWVLFRMGQKKAARRELERAVALPGGSDDPVVWDHLGDVYYRLAEQVKAQQAWKKALSLYEGEGRRRQDDHYKELKGKLRQVQEP